MDGPVLEMAAERALPTDQIRLLGLPDRFISQASRSEQLAEVGLDEAGMIDAVRGMISHGARSPERSGSPASHDPH